MPSTWTPGYAQRVAFRSSGAMASGGRQAYPEGEIEAMAEFLGDELAFRGGGRVPANCSVCV